MKRCNRCKDEKELNFFQIHKNKYYDSICKKCSSEERKLKYKYNKVIINEKCRNYYKENAISQRERSKKYKFSKRNINGKIIKIKIISESLNDDEKVCTKCLVIKNKINFPKDNSKIDRLSSHCSICRNDYFRKRKNKDALFKLKCYLRSNISESIKKMKFVKKFHTIDIIGCSFIEFKIFIENKFKEDMRWENYGEWHIDHIIPISYANTEDEVYKLNYYTNFQPLWAKENLSKGNRYIG